LIPALAGLERAIRHEQNRTSTSSNRDVLAQPRRANQGHINIIARTDKARAEKSAAGFLFEIPIGRRPHVTTPHLPARRQSVASRAVVRTHSSSLADTRNVPVSGAVERLLPHPAPAIRGYGSRRN